MLMISIDLPDMAICTSPGFCAVPEGMFSLAQTMPMTRTFGLSWAMARMAPIMAAPPAMSYFIFSMPSEGLMEMPPLSKVIPLPDQAEHGLLGRAGGLVAHDDQPRLLVGALRDAPERAHLQLFDLVWTVDFALQSHFVAHLLGAVGQDGRRHAVAGLVDQVAGEVLRFADDAALSRCAACSDLLFGHWREQRW